LKTETTLSSNGGLQQALRCLFALGDTVDYKGGEVLKSCFSEFSLNPLVAPHREGHSPSQIKAGE